MSLLPENKPMEKNITPKVFFIWGQSMHGKTYLARQFPDPIIINTDGNGKKIDTPHVDVYDFETFVDVLREIEEGKHTFKTIVIDLVDDIKTFLEEYVCKKYNVENLADAGFGKGYGDVKANVVDCKDFAQFIVDHMSESGITYNIGGKETYSYEEMAAMCFKAADKPLKIKWAPVWLFGVLASLPKIKKEGKHDIILFSKWTLSHDLVGDTIVGEKSFKEYISEYFGK